MRVRSCVFVVSKLGLGVSKFGLGEQIGASDAAVWSMIVCARGAAAVVPMLPASVLSFGLKNEALFFSCFSLYPFFWAYALVKRAGQFSLVVGVRVFIGYVKLKLVSAGCESHWRPRTMWFALPTCVVGCG